MACAAMDAWMRLTPSFHVGTSKRRLQPCPGGQQQILSVEPKGIQYSAGGSDADGSRPPVADVRAGWSLWRGGLLYPNPSFDLTASSPWINCECYGGRDRADRPGGCK